MKPKKIKLVLANLWLFPSKTPHFGLISLSAFIREKNPEVEISIIEGSDIEGEIIEKNPDVIGFTGDTLMYNRVIKLAKSLKSKTRAFLIIGGVHITAMPDSLDRVFDLGIVGEGETTFSSLLELYNKDGDFPRDQLQKIPGLVFYDKNNIINTGRAELIKDIDQLPFPARDLVPMEELYLKDQYNLFGTKRTVAIMTSRGCPYHCRFCGSPVQWGNVRFHSAEYILREIEYLIENYQIDGIMFWDDLFIAPKDRIKKLANLIISKGLNEKLVFTGFARANLIDEEICALLSKMNVKRLIFGLESGSEKVLKYLKKNSVTVANNRQAVVLCRKYGITTSSGFVVGTPGEDIEDLKKTYEFMKKYPLDNTQIYILTPYPGTEIWEMAREKGLISDNLDTESLFVQLKAPTFFDFARKSNSNILRGRIFLNAEYRNNREYRNIIFAMTKLAYIQNLKFYLKIFPYELDLAKRIIWGKIKNIIKQK